MMGLHEKLVEIFYKAATGSKKVRILLTPVATVFFFIYLSLFVVVSLVVDKFLGFPKFFLTPLNIIVSMPILAIGVFFLLWSVLHFIKVKGTPVPFNPPPKLVATGPYAYLRNPQSTGWSFIFLGLGVLFQSISLIFIFTPLFILLSVLKLKTVEEPELEKRFGKEYLEYKGKVPMYIFWLKVEAKKRLPGNIGNKGDGG